MMQRSVQRPFRVGDEVRFVNSKNTGFVISVERYDELGDANVFYKIKIPYGAVWTAKPEDIESLTEK